ncbi:MAG: penicillin-binding protein 2, partial [Candidatus Omnitrophica bacterium]|nr:penicillin-binding protein 2 [Candidatus Omnitrophota bacterium]
MRKFNRYKKNYELNFSLGLLQKLYLLGFIILIGVLFNYQIVKGNYYSKRAKNNYVRVIPLRSMRGTIFDRNNIALAYDKAVFNISVIPYQIRNKKEELFNQLSEFLNYDLKLINKNYKKNTLSLFSPVNIIINIDKLSALRLKERFKDIILITTQPQRYYPYPYQSAHILGYVKEATSFYDKLKKYGYNPLERVGFFGVEQYYDAYLRGNDGGNLIEVDAKGRIVGFLGERIPLKGKNVHLTIDNRIQQIAKDSMGDKKGAIIFMDSDSGELLALFSYPSFDSNAFITGKNTGKFLTDKNCPLINRAIQSTYPIGSIFKPIISISALEEKKITPSTTFNCTGKLTLGSTKFGCWSVHHDENLYEALAHSCNVYFYKVGLILGQKTISKWSKKFKLDSLTGIDLPYEKKGLSPNANWKQKKLKKSWYTGDTVNLSIGQGYMLATPLEATVAINAIGNNGYFVIPSILKGVEQVDSSLSSKTYSGISEKNIKIVKQGMRMTVSTKNGTAKMLKPLNLNIAG